MYSSFKAANRSTQVTRHRTSTDLLREELVLLALVGGAQRAPPVSSCGLREPRTARVLTGAVVVVVMAGSGRAPPVVDLGASTPVRVARRSTLAVPHGWGSPTAVPRVTHPTCQASGATSRESSSVTSRESSSVNSCESSVAAVTTC